MEYLEKYNKMKFAIQECHNIDEIKLIRDKAEAMRYVLIQAKEAPEWIRQAEEIKLRAERKAGELLPEQITIGTKSHPTTLSDMGVTRDQSSNWQRIAGIPEDKFEKYIDTQKEITTSGAVNLARKLEMKDKFNEAPELPKDQYNVFYIDPPWQYRNTGVEGAVDKQYPTMTIEELCKLPIKELTSKNAVLFLWVTNPLLEECFPVINSWGFSYKTNFVWVKKNKKTGIGFYVRGIHELLLICIKGSMLPIYTPLSVIEEEAREHSRKPEIYNIIEKMYPNQKYIELFARNKKEGWTSWGNEISKN